MQYFLSKLFGLQQMSKFYSSFVPYISSEGAEYEYVKCDMSHVSR